MVKTDQEILIIRQKLKDIDDILYVCCKKIKQLEYKVALLMQERSFS
jgi:hypothetical protein